MISGLGPVPNPVLVPGRAIPRSGTGPGRATSRSRAGPRASDPPTPPPLPGVRPPPPTPGPAAPVPAHRLSRGRARSRRTPGASAALMAGGGGAAGSPPPPPSGSFSPPRRARRSPPRSRSRPGCSPAEPPARPLLQRRRCETGASTPVPAPPKPKIGLQIRREGGKSKVGYRGGGPNPKGGGAHLQPVPASRLRVFPQMMLFFQWKRPVFTLPLPHPPKGFGAPISAKPPQPLLLDLFAGIWGVPLSSPPGFTPGEILPPSPALKGSHLQSQARARG